MTSICRLAKIDLHLYTHLSCYLASYVDYLVGKFDTVSHARPHVSAFSWERILSCLKLISIEDHLTTIKLKGLEEGWVLDASCDQ